MMNACLYWIDDAGHTHVMRGNAEELVDYAIDLDHEDIPWKLETFAYTEANAE